MSVIRALIDFIMHIDQHLLQLVEQYGTWTYGILFAIIFIETGLVVMPFLPGDSLLFAAGAMAAQGVLDVAWLIGLLTVAAILGDTVNYWIGAKVGPKVFSSEKSRWFNKKYLDRTHAFYEKYGGKTIIFARFIPIIRTFAPFVAGIGKMSYGKFLAYNAIGGIVWIVSFTLAGYWFGNIPAVKHNFTLVILGIIFVSLLPPVIELLRRRLKRKG